MPLHNTRHDTVFSIILASLAVVVTLAGCRDDFTYMTEEIPDAEVEIQGELIFKPLVPTEVQTRAEAPEGEKYKGIKSLYVFFFTPEGKPMEKYSGEVDFTPAPSEGSTHEHVTFNKRVRAGQYYVYAVANISNKEKNDLMGKSIENFRKYKLAWDDDLERDLEMFGVFTQGNTEDAPIPDNEGFEADELLTITPTTSHIHSWMRRAVSKVTVDFNGASLKEGCTVYIKSARLMKVPDSVFIGQTSAVGPKDTINSTVSTYSISYGNGTSYGAWPSVTKDKTFSPAEVWGDQGIESFHDDAAKALPCYENMQGEHEDKSKLQDSDGDGIIDSSEEDGVYDGTYLEVEGYYVANRPEYKSQGKIIYKFKLGKDAVRNFDVVRNHHYKITMRFKGYGNDVDWHVDYFEECLDITYPQDVNYQGKFFVPDPDYVSMSNGGHTFKDDNVITVTSFVKENTGNRWVAPEISYTYYSYNTESDDWEVDKPDAGWLTCREVISGDGNSQRQYVFKAAMTDQTPFTINSRFSTDPEGTKDEPHNLSNEDGDMEVKNTANCYMVGAPGWYCFPLVYGNAISDGKDPNAEAYASEHFVNHLNKHITHPYIIDNEDIDLSDVSVKLIWQDAQDLVIPKDIIYDPTLFDNKGGIKFHIAEIQEGNAVIALIDNKAKEDEFVEYDREDAYGESGSTKAIWSWHIWATRFGFDFEKTIRVVNYEGETYDLMPVNLGWCSGDREIRYYRRRKCDIKFKVGDKEIIRTIEQYPYFAVPRGDHPYYQWGRKDPFVGSNGLWENKPRWDHSGKDYGTDAENNPPRLYPEPGKFQNNVKKKHTVDCQEVLIKNPDKFHNGPRQPVSDGKYVSINRSYEDLWSNKGCKTVYDPCPPGYQVGCDRIFTGFTTTGAEVGTGAFWYDVLESNLPADYYDIEHVSGQIVEFYTTPRKVQSISFPVCGYRDYDGEAGVYEFTDLDKVPGTNGRCHVWTNKAKDAINSYDFMFCRASLTAGTDWKGRGVIVFPRDYFFNTDGYGVRPVRSSTKQSE